MNELRIVLVDDHELVRAGLRALVDASPGMRVVGEAGNGVEAIERARELRPDVLVLDLSMPVMDGAEAAERLAREMPELKVLALTAHGDRARVLRLLAAGAAGYVLKRAATAELVEAIRAVAAGETYVDGSLAGGLLGAGAPDEASASAASETLSEREEEVLRRTAWGETNKEIGVALGISTRTVETYKARITGKLGLRSRRDMVRYALQRGWLVAE